MLKPLGDRVIIEVEEPKEETVGGIVLANNAKQKPQSGKIVAVGNGNVTADGKTIPMNVKVGDVVVYDKYAGSEVTYDEKKYLVLHEKDLMAIED
ncbi:hypothetical protein IV38_GL002087 [Lactobacillus selangorensis]|uniref:Co-chaperonin GroES n=1 Tax=Lactobacillus selangorensis TaxID=81857 RepID=A0A0R2FSR0_9LACO|nr:co-chaperone GroES [Lactobacillus selangorensis]KRN27435.1 hypothetical protein IV38_GL002087 [Lactobacillus selangorensis]KRN31368.1 hypothetical protein IV40_GL001363 [Lactobacillus selangorensis]